MSLIGMGNGYNTSAQWKDRRRQEKNRIKDIIDSANTSAEERNYMINHQSPNLKTAMDEMYKITSTSYSKDDLLGKVSDAYSVLIDERIKNSNPISQRRISKLEKMVSNISRNIKNNSATTLNPRIKEHIAEAYRTYLADFQGLYGQELYNELK